MRLRTFLQRLGLSLGWLLVGSSVLWAQAPVRNPTGLAFQCLDHDRDDQHEIDIVRESDGMVVATLLGGDPPADAAGEIRAVAGTIRSDNSLPSDIWDRAPGRPGQPVPR